MYRIVNSKNAFAREGVSPTFSKNASAV